MRKSAPLVLLSLLLAAACGDNEHAKPRDAGTDGAADPFCGDGIVNQGEDCDDLNLTSGDGCEADCRFTCVQNTQCDDGDPCTGTELCGPAHICALGTPLAENASCGSGRSCRAGVCTAAGCGDGVVTAPEECEDGNAMSGDGCDSCRFSCLSTDSTRNCAPADSCAGAGTCNDTTHVCAAGTPVANNLPCPADATGFCRAGVCVHGTCPNGTTEPGEACDDGNSSDGDGCDHDCTFSCVTPASDCPIAPACRTASCTTAHVCQTQPDLAQDGHVCGTNLVCKTGACVAPTAVCGNSVVEGGEDCDFGGGNGANTGCESNCKFSCTLAPNSCANANACDGVETCGAVTVSGHAGQRCSAGTPLANGASCAPPAGNICLAQTCRPSTCGDGFVDAARGEECEPPGAGTCDAQCHTIACGNGRRETGEQCDDHNLTNLDGCDATCRFEQDVRATYLQMQFATDTTCTTNRLGAAIVGGTARTQLQSSLTTGVMGGTINILLRLAGLDDLAGNNDPALVVGILDGTTVAGTGYDGTADLDWWYTANPMALNAMRQPTATMAGAIAARVFTAGPGNVTLRLNLGGQAAALRMTGTRLTVNLGAASAPRSSTATTPGHLAAENLDPALMSFATTGTQTATGSGHLCGDVSADSLRQVPIPAALVGCGIFNCTQCYTANNSLLDVIVSGCNVFGTQIAATNPDHDDPTVAALGAGPPYSLGADAQHVVNSCRDHLGATAPLAACLLDASYSSFFRFAGDRVIIK